MAGKRNAGPDPGYSRLRADLEAGTLGTVYIFHGEETYLRDFYLAEVRRKLVPAGFEEFNFHRLDAKGLTVQALSEAVEPLPVMAERTMVQVVDWDLYRLNEEQRAGFIALLEDFPSYCCLALVYDHIEYKPNKTSKKLYGALEKYAQVVKFGEQGEEELMRWIARRFRAGGHTIDRPAAGYLILTCGSLMNGLIPEIEKISAYAKAERISKADIDAVAAPVPEARVFDMTNAVSRGDFDRAAEALGSLLQLQEEPFALLALLGRELRKLHAARVALDTGRDRFWLMEQWKIKDYPARVMMENARQVSREWCACAVRRCYELDLRIKSVAGADGSGELKMLLMELAQGAARASS